MFRTENAWSTLTALVVPPSSRGWRRPRATDARAVSYGNLPKPGRQSPARPNSGGSTAENNSGVNLLYLPGGYRVSYTGQRTIQDGTQFHIGVRPIVLVNRTIQAVVGSRDESPRRRSRWCRGTS